MTASEPKRSTGDFSLTSAAGPYMTNSIRAVVGGLVTVAAETLALTGARRAVQTSQFIPRESYACSGAALGVLVPHIYPHITPNLPRIYPQNTFCVSGLSPRRSLYSPLSSGWGTGHHP